jgi:exopolysaccharide/PEP-CTERM locus tyrosine autokinase
LGKIFDALEKFSKESGASRSDKIKNSDYEVLMQFDSSTGKIDMADPEILKDVKGVKRLMTYRLINDDGTLTPAGRAKYEEMTRTSKKKRTATDRISIAADKPISSEKGQKEKVLPGFEKAMQSDWALLMKYDRKTGNLLKYDPESGQLDEDSKNILQDPATVQRLIDNHMILPGGWLTPEAKSECKKIEEKPEKNQTGAFEKPEIIVAADTPAKLAEPNNFLRQQDMDALLQYDPKTLKLDLSDSEIFNDPGIIERLLESDMIDEEGRLSPKALVRCRVLTIWKQQFEKKRVAPEKPKPSISEKLQAISEKGESQKPFGEDGENKLKIIPLGKNKIENKDKIKTEAKEEEEKVPEKVDNFMTALEVQANLFESAESSLERKFTLGKTLAKYDQNAIDNNLVSFLNPASFESEQFKILRTNLLFPASGKSPRSILVTSVAPGDGKSFVAANLAVSVAAHVNWNVLLVDCDLRRPSIHRLFGFQEASGLSDYLSSGRELHSFLLKTAVERLTILPAGGLPSNPSELLSSEKMKAFIKEVTERYNDRLIILDSPPPEITAESTALARHVDGILLVVKYAKTRGDDAAELISKLGKEKILGAVVNNLDAGFSKYHKKYYGSEYFKK